MLKFFKVAFSAEDAQRNCVLPYFYRGNARALADSSRLLSGGTSIISSADLTVGEAVTYAVRGTRIIEQGLRFIAKGAKGRAGVLAKSLIRYNQGLLFAVKKRKRFNDLNRPAEVKQRWEE